MTDPTRSHGPERFAWAKLNSYGILLAGLMLLSLADLIDPANASLARALGEVPSGLTVMIGTVVVAGALLMWGFVRNDRVAETAGLVLLTLSVLAQTVTAFAYLGWTTYSVTRLALLAIVAACSWARTSALWSRHGLVITIPARKRKR